MWVIYLGDVVGGVSALFIIMGMCLGFFTPAVFALAHDMGINVKLKHAVMSIVIGLLLVLTSILIPSKDTFYTMAAVKYGEEFVAKPEVKEIGDKVYRILNQKLDEVLENK